jgi:signal transduction histidine kinase
MVAVNQPSVLPGRAPRVPARALPHGRGIRAALTLVAPLAIAAGLLSAEEVFGLPGSFMAVSLVIGAVVVAAMVFVGLRDLSAAEARADAALERAASAEAVQRARADELAGVLEENDALMARLRRELSANQHVAQQLLQASKMGAVGELAAAVAHQVNNPLTGILGFAELLLSEVPADDPRHDEVAVIRDEAVRARTIVRALLEFARPRPPQRIPASLNDLARSTLELVRVRAHEADVAIVADYGEVPCLELDPDAVKQVFLNLFNNAIDAMPEGGTLRVSAEQVGDRVRVVVGDTGIGMDEETRPRIFTPFFSTRAANGDGMGLGLSVSRQIVENHGGTIEVESTLGEGAVFTVWLPASLEAFEDPVLAEGAEPERADAAGLAGAQDVAGVAGLAGSRSAGCEGAAA